MPTLRSPCQASREARLRTTRRDTSRVSTLSNSTVTRLRSTAIRGFLMQIKRVLDALPLGSGCPSAAVVAVRVQFDDPVVFVVNHVSSPSVAGFYAPATTAVSLLRKAPRNQSCSPSMKFRHRPSRWTVCTIRLPRFPLPEIAGSARSGSRAPGASPSAASRSRIPLGLLRRWGFTGARSRSGDFPPAQFANAGARLRPRPHPWWPDGRGEERWGSAGDGAEWRLTYPRRGR